MKTIIPGLVLVFLFAFTFSGCDLLKNSAFQDASTEIPVVQEETLPSILDPESESVNSAQNDQELLQVLEKMDEPSFGDDLNTLESGLR